MRNDKGSASPRGRGPAALILLGLALLVGRDTGAASATLTTITVDGSFSDWDLVMLNPLQVSVDGNGSAYGAGCYPTNPDRDCPNMTYQRDITKFVWTYDSTNVYTYIERPTSSATLTYFFIMDVNANGVAESTDRVLQVDWKNGGSALSATLYAYAPASPSGDPLGCPNTTACPTGAVGFVDGYTMPGTTGTQIWPSTGAQTENGGDGVGTRFEVSVPWSQLGVAAGSPILWHVSSATSALNHADDNVGDPTGSVGTFGIYALTLTPNHSGSANSPGTVDYCHTLTNTGQFSDSYTLTASSTLGFSVSFYSDAGGCTAGTLLGTGTTTLSTIASGGTANVIARVTVPSGYSGSTDVTQVTATSVTKPSTAFASVQDTTALGPVTLYPNLSASGVAGASVDIGPHTVANNQAVSDSFNYFVKSAHGWSVALYADSSGAPGALLGTDSNGDGVWDSSTPNTGVLAPGASQKVWLVVTIPGGAALNTVDAISLTAVSTTSASVSGSAADSLKVLAGLSITPSYSSASGTQLMGAAGSVIYLPHTITNSLSTANTVTLSQTGTLATGYSFQWFTDPNGDGNPSDGTPITGPFTLAAFGGTLHIVTAVTTPASGTPSSSAVATTVSGTGSMTAQDNVQIQAFGTYADALATLASRYFPACATIYAQGTGLTGPSTTTYQVQVIDPFSVTQQNSNLPVDSNGVGISSYTLTSSNAAGSWTFKLMQGTTQLAQVSPVVVENAGTAAVSAPSTAVSGSVDLSAALTNGNTSSTWAGTTASFTLTDPLGAQVASSAVAVAGSLAPGSSTTAFTTFASVSYSVYGQYTAAVTWKSSCGGTIATSSQTIPNPPPAPGLTAPADGAWVSTTKPVFSGTAQSGATVNIYIDGTLVGTASGPSFSFTPSVALSLGAHTWYVTQTVNGLTGAASSTRSFSIDTSAPVAGTVNDGLGADISTQTSTTSLSANWTGFSDAQSGISGYEWALGSTPGGTDIQPFTSVGAATSATANGLTLTGGTTYYATVRATNGAGLTVTATSNGVLVDGTPPVAGTVNDGAGADINFQTSTTTLSANWTGFSDAQSGISGYAWAIGTTPGGTDIQGFTSVGAATSATNAALALVSGTTYYVTVKATNGVGLTASATSNGVTVDTSPPVAGTVNDGAGADIAFQTSTTTLSANWTGFSDAQSGISGYAWAIGTTPGGTDIQAFTSVGSATSASNAGLTLLSGTTYYVTVRATDGAGLSVTATSNGVTVDSSAPVAGTVNDGSGPDVDYQSSTTTLSANWSGFSDAQSGISGYAWAIGTTPGGTNVQGFTSVGAATSATASSLSLVNGTRYYVTVRATDGAGLSVTATSNGVTVDTSPPLAGTVNDGTAADISSQGSTTTLSANWSGFSDAQSGISGYEWALGSTPGGTDIQGFVSVGTATTATATGLSLVTGTTYYATVRATNGAGLTVTASSNGVLVDSSTPVAGTVNDGLGADLQFQASTSSLSANWSGFSAASGISGYAWAIGTTPGGTDIQAFTSVGLANSATASPLTLTTGTRYYATVRATSGSGQTVTVSSNGVLVDGTAPVAGTVNDGTGPDINLQTSLTTLSANWSGFSDPESGIAGYEWAIGTSAGATDVQGFTSVGTAAAATRSGLTLTNGATYYVAVRATNGSGLTTVVVSNGVKVDATPPLAGVVNDGTGADINLQSSTTTLAANWTGFSDPQSGIAGYEWAIGTSPGATDVQGFTFVGSATSAGATGLTLSTGVTYYVSVRATNGVGLTVIASSDGVTVDGTPPIAGVVNDGTGADLSFQSSTTTLAANWTPFSDPESGVTGYEWAIGTSPGATDVQPFVPVGTATSASNAALALASGTTYYVTVRATNGVGLTSVASSNGVLVDGTAPVAGIVNDGTGADIAFQGPTTPISANWSGFSAPSGIAGYEWAIGTTPGGTDVQGFAPVGTGTSATNATLGTLAAGTYYVTVRATSGSGLTVTASSNGVKVDVTAPAGGTVNDGTAGDIAFQSSTTALSANWFGFLDPESGIAGYEWAIGTTPGGTDVQDFTSVGSATSATNASLALVQGVTYYATVRATNGVGLTSVVFSNGVLVDATPPLAGTVNDGTGVDIDVQASTTTLAANWTGFSDPESGITGYEWAIGTSPGATDVQSFVAVGAATSASNGLLTLTAGTTYYVTVRATNGAGLTVTASSNGVLVDPSVPVAGTVNDGLGADLAFQSSTTTVSANWFGFSASSGIAGYEWAIGTTPGGTDAQDFTFIGLTSSATNSALALTAGTTYYVTVRATSVAGTTVTATSNGVTVDPTPPVAGTVNDGTGLDIDFQSSATTLSANWTGFSDLQSGIAGYEWALGTTPGGTDVLAFTSVGAALNASASGLTLLTGVTYYATVRATDGAGLTVTATSNGVTVDAAGPTAGTVNDGLAADIAFQSSTTSLSANWAGFADPVSGISGYEWAIGTTPGATDVQGFTPLGMGSSATASALSLTQGATYYVTVRATSGAGLTVTATSNGVLVDDTAPLPGVVRDGPGADLATQTSISALSANWSGFSDPESGVVGYEWALGTTPGGTDVQGFTAVGTATTASATGLGLRVGATYYASVRATNGAGLVVSVSSNGVTVVAPGGSDAGTATGADAGAELHLRGGGCGCDVSGSGMPAVWAGLGFLALGLGRRSGRARFSNKK